MNPLGKFTIGAEVVVMVNGEPQHRVRIVHSETGITYDDAKIAADKHRELVQMSGRVTYYDYEWQATSQAV